MAYGRLRHSRAEVRRQLWRARERARRSWKRMFERGWMSDQERTWWTEERKALWICRNARDRKRCSCWMCRNFREMMGPTLQERKIALHEADEVEELLEGGGSDEVEAE